MKAYLLIFLSSITLLNCIDSDFNVVYISNSENEFTKYSGNIYIEVDISFGSNEDKFKSELDITSFLTVVSGVEAKEENIKKFNQSLSSTFIKKRNEHPYYLEKFYRGIIGEDSIKLGESESIKDISFAVATSWSYNINTGCYIGLTFKAQQLDLSGLNLLEQLKNHSIIEKQTWYLEFNDNNKGKFVVGKYPHEINNKKYNEEKLYKIDISRSFSKDYSIEFDEIYYGNINNYENRYAMKEHLISAISLSTRLIYCTYVFGEYIYNKFFKKKIEDKICFHDYLKKNDAYSFNYNYYYCNSDINLSEMENLYFTIRSRNVTFVLEPKDLFYKFNGSLYYLIVYKDYFEEDSNKDTNWEFGLQFLQKYTLTFNRDDKVLYYYNDDKDSNDNNNNNNGGKDNNNGGKDNNNESSSSLKYIIIIIVLSLFFIGCIAFLIYYIKKIKPRKAKANELNEDFDYQAKDNYNNQNDPFAINNN